MPRKITLPKDKLVRKLRIQARADELEAKAAEAAAKLEEEKKAKQIITDELEELFGNGSRPNGTQATTGDSVFQRLRQSMSERQLAPQQDPDQSPLPETGIVRRTALRDRTRRRDRPTQPEEPARYTVAVLRRMDLAELRSVAAELETNLETDGSERPRALASLVPYVLTLQSDLLDKTTSEDEEDDVREYHYMRRSLSAMSFEQLNSVVGALVERTGCEEPPRYRNTRDYINWIMQEQRNEIDRANNL